VRSAGPRLCRRGQTMKNTTAIIAVVVALFVGYFIRDQIGGSKDSGGGGTAVATAAPDPSVERYKVLPGSAPQTGQPGAKVTIIEFSDYQCPFCSRVEPTISQIKKAYGKEVRVAFKHNPLPFHPNAAPAARAALAAREQGDEKFWKYHEILFKNQDKLDDQHYVDFAGEAGLN